MPNAPQKLKVNNGTPQELYEEWTKTVASISEALSEDPVGNLYVLKISKPLLAHIFDTKTAIEIKQTPQPEKPLKQLSNYGAQLRGKLQNFMLSPGAA